MAERYLYIDINPELLTRALGMPGQIEILGSLESQRGPTWVRLKARSSLFEEVHRDDPIPAVELQITDQRLVLLATHVDLPQTGEAK